VCQARSTSSVGISDGFAWTSKMYRRATNGGIYSECTCWYCEATRSLQQFARERQSQQGLTGYTGLMSGLPRSTSRCIRKMYRRATNGGIYSECTCWYCEATRTSDLYNRLIPVVVVDERTLTTEWYIRRAVFVVPGWAELVGVPGQHVECTIRL
jgi:hypothetical protein